MTRWWRRMGVAAGVACGVCCALPVILVLTGVGLTSSLAAVFEVFERASIVLAVLALGAAAVLWIRRRRRRACQVPERVADLGMPGWPR